MHIDLVVDLTSPTLIYNGTRTVDFRFSKMGTKWIESVSGGQTTLELVKKSIKIRTLLIEFRYWNWKTRWLNLPTKPRSLSLPEVPKVSSSFHDMIHKQRLRKNRGFPQSECPLKSIIKSRLLEQTPKKNWTISTKIGPGKSWNAP